MISPEMFQLERASARRRPEPQEDTTQMFVRLAEIHGADLARPAQDDAGEAGPGRGLPAIAAKLVRRLSGLRRFKIGGRGRG